jgi:hypothetical protein
MLRRWRIALAGLTVVLGSIAAAGTAAASPAGTAAAAPAASHLIRPAVHFTGHTGPGTRPFVLRGGRADTVYSTNWSGYAATGRTYTKVSATWVEPTGTCSKGDQYSSFWVGLDGYTSSTVEQTGSEMDCIGSTAKYYSWYEMYPAYPKNFSNTVKPGDHFYGSVTYNGSSSYTLVLKDTTRGWSHTINATLSGAKNSSAEVIAEAPCCTAGGAILPLAHFSPVTFSSADANGSAIGNYHPTQIVMVDNSGRAKDSVSSLSGGNTFKVTWLRST